MRIISINNSTLNQKFYGKPKTQLPKTIFERLGVDMTTEAGYKGEPSYVPPPPEVSDYFRKLGVDWSTRVDENSKKRSLFD